MKGENVLFDMHLLSNYTLIAIVLLVLGALFYGIAMHYRDLPTKFHFPIIMGFPICFVSGIILLFFETVIVALLCCLAVALILAIV